MIVDPLQIFVTVVEQKNFSRAAELLHVSQPNVSLHIRNLEEEFGVQLLIRSPKQVRVTEAGKLLYARAKQILAHYEDAKQEIREMLHSVSGTLRVGSSFTVGEYILPKVLAAYTNQYPQVDIGVKIANTEEVVQALRASEIDLGFIEGNTVQEDIEVVPFMEDEMIVIAPPDHPLSQRRLLEGSMLQDQVWITRERGSGTRAYSDKFIADLQLHMKRQFVFSSSQGIKEAVMAGLGLAVLSRWTVRKELAAGEVQTLRIRNTKITRPLSIVRRREPSSKAADAFIRKLEAFAASHTW
ncbi:LysR family transcriptional regulator [Ectobacillus ponti]|uniref:LysR family transcriptional regulator n=1 Tax=Ectobacillus ponti TaxID=2961894 RepID=A0AA41X713_9BACI|nr:LysR family transcriptional regulator [Ectobacillus ponti]MCP8970007.1 LysR family transcriptional regulator [Ectobacillus ponti]